MPGQRITTAALFAQQRFKCIGNHTRAVNRHGVGLLVVIFALVVHRLFKIRGFFVEQIVAGRHNIAPFVIGKADDHQIFQSVRGKDLRQRLRIFVLRTGISICAAIDKLGDDLPPAETGIPTVAGGGICFRLKLHLFFRFKHGGHRENAVYFRAKHACQCQGKKQNAAHPCCRFFLPPFLPHSSCAFLFYPVVS